MTVAFVYADAESCTGKEVTQRTSDKADVSIGALDEPVNGPRPQLFLSPSADGESMCPARQMIFSLSVELIKVVQRLGLGARNEMGGIPSSWQVVE